MWIVVTQYSAFEINCRTFDSEEEAKKHYDEDMSYLNVHCFLAEVKESS